MSDLSCLWIVIGNRTCLAVLFNETIITYTVAVLSLNRVTARICVKVGYYFLYKPTRFRTLPDVMKFSSLSIWNIQFVEMMGEQGLALFYELRKLLNPNKHSLNYKRFIDSLWKIRSRVHIHILWTHFVYIHDA